MRRSASMAVALFLLVTSTAEAQVLQDSLADTLFKDGQELMKAGRYAEACAKFSASYTLEPAAGTLLDLARCEEKNGNLATAWSAYTKASALNAKAGNRESERYARGKAEALQPRLNRIRVQVPFPAAGQEVRLDGTAIPAELWNSAMPIDAGPHKLEASAPDRAPWSSTVTVVATTSVEVVVIPELRPETAVVAAGELDSEPVKVVEARSDEPAAAPPPMMMPVVTAEVRRMSYGRVAGIVIGGVGVAGLGAGIGLLASARGLANQRDELCPPGPGYCYSQEAFEQDHDARVRQRWGLVAGGVGLVALGIGTVLAVLKEDVRVAPQSEVQEREAPDEFSLEVGPVGSGNGVQVVLGGAW